ncbi:ATP synthase F1 subunit gamma [Bacteroidota bacterium]|nr:ATP synthase F1 subunit gamma [Bacteroidota bacterium]MDC3114885.1 ATP synthase F1 subunit gamma [Bacteroidota bacterium]MDC3229692.1 ATP synthase F1 subunit gamma [Bacteroidota bacterium]
MPNLKEIKSRITSVKSTIQITSAMKMVSAAKLKKAQDAIIQLRPYSNKLTEIMSSVSSASEDSSQNKYSEVRDVNKILLVPITSNRGLCGGFNANILKKTIEIEKDLNSKSELTILSIGKKSSEFFKKNKYNVHSTHDEVFQDVNYEDVSKIAELILNDFANEKFDKVIIVYNQFKNAATQIVMQEDFLPLNKTQSENSQEAIDYIYEPGKDEILNELIPKSLKTQLFKAILDSNASEHGARMTAMHKATENATELKNELTLSYNKARQAAITGEILEIVGGAEALNG